MPLASLNYHLGNYQDVIWLVGDGRSGTTWISDLINWNGRYREIFEPFHPVIVKQASNFEFFHYIRPSETEGELADFLNSVFDGRFKHCRADVSKLRLFYKGLLVKDIFVNLLIPWVETNLPQVKKVLLIRNPFSVALSKQKKKNWIWMTDPKLFLKQTHLYEDYLAPFEETILSVGEDFIERQVLIWAIVHYVPLKYIAGSGTHVLFYESLVKNPEEELSGLFKYLYGEYDENDPRLLSKIHKPARTFGKSGEVFSQRNLIDSWMGELSPHQIDRGIEILHCFGLDRLYGEDAMPRKDALAI